MAQRVAANVRALRRARDMTTAELSLRLAGLGTPILDTGISKIEAGTRRVDVDDLAALAMALGVDVRDLLFAEATVTMSEGGAR